MVDVGCGAGLDSLVAARMVGPTGRVIGVDMTLAMLDKARGAAISAGLPNVDFREGFAEALPIEDGWADVVTSNGVPNLNRTGGCPVPGRVAKLATRSDETVLVFGPVDAHQDVSPARLRSSASWTRKLPQQGRNATPR